jgi:hypothetical protein
LRRLDQSIKAPPRQELFLTAKAQRAQRVEKDEDEKIIEQETPETTEKTYKPNVFSSVFSVGSCLKGKLLSKTMSFSALFAPLRLKKLLKRGRIEITTQIQGPERWKQRGQERQTA